MRQQAYRELFRYQLEPGLADSIRQAINGHDGLGRPEFSEQVSAALGGAPLAVRRGGQGRSQMPDNGRISTC